MKRVKEASSPNHGLRPAPGKVGLVILHYTGMRDRDSALERLKDPESGVSAHWLIDEAGEIFRLVPEEMRAWHAGEGSWRLCEDINSVSVGIEMMNPGHEFGLREFPGAQIDALEGLLADVLQRHGLGPEDVVGHSDVAPLRKRDPGELFPWKRLAERGLAVWPEDLNSSVAGTLIPGSRGRSVRVLQERLQKIGYGITVDGIYGPMTRAVVFAFQRRFRPAQIDGTADSGVRVLVDKVAELTKERAQTV